MPDVPGVSSAEELSALPAGELAARLAEAYRLIGDLTARVEQLERLARRDSSTSSRPPSSDSPYQKKSRDRSLRERGKRRPGKQPGDPGTTMRLVDDPDERLEFPPSACRGCGTGLAGAPVTAQRRHQVTDIEPAPAPKVTEYVAQAKQCPCCGTLTEGELPAHVRARASFGPETCAQAANLTTGHHIPICRATLLLCQLAGVAVSAGWMAGIRGKAAALVEASGFMERVRELLATAPAVHADETPARAATGIRYVHLACTAYLTHMHTGDRSADAIDTGGVLPGYQGVIVRDGYYGYGHLTDALHAWCGAHLPSQRELAHLAQASNFKTRHAKQGTLDLAQAHAGWADRLARTLGVSLASVAPSVWPGATGRAATHAHGATGPAAELELSRAAQKAVALAQQEKSTWTRADVIKYLGRVLPRSGLDPAAAAAKLEDLADRALRSEFEPVACLEAPEPAEVPRAD